MYEKVSVVGPHPFYMALVLALGKNFDAALAPAAPAPTLIYCRSKFLKEVKRKGPKFFFLLDLCNENCPKCAWKKQQNHIVCVIF
jgi:hypothetical protein